MKFTIDTETKTLVQATPDGPRALALYSRDAFEVISEAWLKIGWNEKYMYTFTWMGRPIIQMPEDMIRVQEVIYRLKPDVILETGVAHGGSLIFYASLCKAIEHGRVIGVDIEIRPHNRQAIAQHELCPWITLVEGSSVAPEVVQHVKSMIKPNETVLVLLDSNHTRDHVLAELEAYHDLVSPGWYIVATDGIMAHVHDVPRGKAEWVSDNPMTAGASFLATHPQFALEQPPWMFNESELQQNVTNWPAAWLRRR